MISCDAPPSPATEPMFTILPPVPRSIIARPTACVTRKTPDLGAARRGAHVPVYVEGRCRAEDDPPRPVYGPAVGPQRAGAGRPEELDPEIRGQKGLALVEQAPAGSAHGGVEDGRDQSTVD